jgi:hypothetical protein
MSWTLDNPLSTLKYKFLTNSISSSFILFILYINNFY